MTNNAHSVMVPNEEDGLRAVADETYRLYTRQ